MTWGFVAIGGATLGAALISSDASSSAAKGQQAATQAGINQQARQLDVSRADSAPYRAAGVSAIGQLRQLLGIEPGSQGPISQSYAGSLVDSAGGKPAPNAELYGSDPGYRKAWDEYAAIHQERFGKGYTSDSDVSGIEREVRNRLPTASADPAQGASGAPGAAPTTLASPLNRNFSISDFWNDPVVQASYQSGLDLGTKALKNAAPLTTGLDSGAALKELTKFGTDYTGNMAAGSQARFVGDQTNTFNKLAAMAGIGQTSVGQTTAAGTNTANNVSQLLTGNANAQGAAKIAGANAFGGGINSVANYWQQQQTLANLKSGNTGATGYTPAPNSDWYAG